jgi:oligopeptidase B
MRTTAALQQELYDETLAHIKQTDLSVPYRLGEYFYYSRTEEGRQYPIFARKHGSLDSPEEVTLDLNVLAQEHAYFSIGAYQVSDDGRLLAYTVDTTGYRQYALRVRDLRSGADLAEDIPRVNDVAWASDATTLFYTTEDAQTKRHDSFWRHTVGEPDSTLLYVERDELYDIACARSNDRAFIFLAAYSKATTEWWSIPAQQPGEALRTIAGRTAGHRYSVEHHAGWFYILTNRGAQDFRLVRAPEDAPGEEAWAEVVPERVGVHLSDLDVFERHAVLRGRSGGFGNLEILDLESHTLRAVDLPETVHSVLHQPNPEFHTGVYRFTYTSLVTPNSVFELDLSTGARTLLKVTEVPGYDAARYETELQHAVARDGTQVPISLVYRAGRPRDGSAPLLLYGYGSYGLSIDPTFSAARLTLLDRGVAFGIAHVRGGGELGEAWRLAGNLQNKLHTFTDFIDCAEHLIAKGYTSPARLAAQGGSAGGLLMGAVSNMRPDLFGAVVSQVPFVDVVNTMLDATLPLTTGEYLEWGDPNVEADYRYMLRYSPYDNVAERPYPASLVKVSINDSQVPYWEGAKLVAKVRALRSDAKPLLLVTNFGAGHGGASGRYDAIKETAFNNAFVLAATASSFP